jgi:hypothetical protein
MKTTKLILSFPKPLLFALKGLGFTKAKLAKAIKVVTIIWDDFIQDRKGLKFWEFRNYPSNYWKKVLGSHYNEIIIPLKNASIIQSNESYSTETNECKGYRLNPDFFCAEILKEETQMQRKPKSNTPLSKYSRKIMRSVRLNTDIRNIYLFIDDYVDGGAIEAKLLRNQAINQETFELSYWIDGKKHFHWVKLNEALAIAKTQNLDLIQDGKKFLVASYEYYLSAKKNWIRFSYRRNIEKIANRKYYANRGENNNRLNHNLTNMPSILLPFLTLDKERIKGVDLSNSQFVFFARLLEKGHFTEIIKGIEERTKQRKQATKEATIANMFLNNRLNSEVFCTKNPELTEDVALFIKFAKNGKLYEFIRDELNLGRGEAGRKKAKQMMFELFFSSHKNTSTRKTDLKKILPVLIEIIDTFKKEKGDNQFAILLQKFESEVFIDRIYSKLANLGFKALTKHDSLLCKESDVEAVEAFIRAELDQVFGEGEYQLKVEDC